MEIIDRGNGIPLVLVPGIQGRWEYLRPAVDALSASCRVLTFQLGGERGSDAQPADFNGLGPDADRIARTLDDRQIDRAVICGVSFGGLIALRFAATHPERTAALILTSTPGPGFHLIERHRFYTRAPRLFGALFLAESPLRLRPEIKAALPALRERLRFTGWQLRTLLSAPLSVTRMARRARCIEQGDPAADARRVSAPTLIITGEPHLDRVVNTTGTSKYADLISGARCAVLAGTGHLGSITKPKAFAAVVDDFIKTASLRAGACAQGRAS